MNQPMEPCVLKTRAQYESALAVVEELMGRNIETGSKEGERLELFAMLVENYEKEHFDISFPISPLKRLQDSNYDTNEAIKIATEMWAWKQLSRSMFLPENILDKYAEYIDWDHVSKYYDLSLDFIERHVDKVNWDFVFAHDGSYKFLNKNITQEFLNKHTDKYKEEYW